VGGRIKVNAVTTHKSNQAHDSLLIDEKVEVRAKHCELLKIVLQSRSQSVRVRSIRQPAVENELVAGREPQPVLVVVAVHVVGVYAHEALGCTQLDALSLGRAWGLAGRGGRGGNDVGGRGWGASIRWFVHGATN